MLISLFLAVFGKQCYIDFVDFVVMTLFSKLVGINCVDFVVPESVW